MRWAGRRGPVWILCLQTTTTNATDSSFQNIIIYSDFFHNTTHHNITLSMWLVNSLWKHFWISFVSLSQIYFNTHSAVGKTPPGGVMTLHGDLTPLLQSSQNVFELEHFLCWMSALNEKNLYLFILIHSFIHLFIYFAVELFAYLFFFSVVFYYSCIEFVFAPRFL